MEGIVRPGSCSTGAASSSESECAGGGGTSLFTFEYDAAFEGDSEYDSGWINSG